MLHFLRVLLLALLSHLPITAQSATPQRAHMARSLTRRAYKQSTPSAYFSSFFPLTGPQEAKALTWDDIGYWTAECICDEIREEATSMSVQQGFEAAKNRYLSSFWSEGALYRQCQESAITRKAEQLDLFRTMVTAESYIPPAEFPKVPYEQLVAGVHQSIGFDDGVCLCMKDVKDNIKHDKKVFVAGRRTYRNYLGECYRSSVDHHQQTVSLRTVHAPTAQRPSRYRFVARRKGKADPADTQRMQAAGAESDDVHASATLSPHLRSRWPPLPSSVEAIRAMIMAPATTRSETDAPAALTDGGQKDGGSFGEWAAAALTRARAAVADKVGRGRAMVGGVATEMRRALGRTVTASAGMQNPGSSGGSISSPSRGSVGTPKLPAVSH